jgi:hypothetical protein
MWNGLIRLRRGSNGRSVVMKALAAIKVGEFIKLLSNCQLIRKDFVPLS